MCPLSRDTTLRPPTQLCENPANRTDIIDAGALPCLYDHCSASDSRVRGMAIWTLTALAEDEEHR